MDISGSKGTADVQNLSQFRRKEKEQERRNCHLLNVNPKH